MSPQGQTEKNLRRTHDQQLAMTISQELAASRCRDSGLLRVNPPLSLNQLGPVLLCHPLTAVCQALFETPASARCHTAPGGRELPVQVFNRCVSIKNQSQNRLCVTRFSTSCFSVKVTQMKIRSQLIVAAENYIIPRVSYTFPWHLQTYSYGKQLQSWTFVLHPHKVDSKGPRPSGLIMPPFMGKIISDKSWLVMFSVSLVLLDVHAPSV